MHTISETRTIRLAILVKNHKNSLAELNEAIGLARTDATLSQIRTRAPHSKTRKPRVMGDDLARKIEKHLCLELGWMDTPPTLFETHGEDNALANLLKIAENLPPNLYATALRLMAALITPTTTGINHPEHTF